MNPIELPVEMFKDVRKRAGQDERWKSILLRIPMDLFKHIDAVAEASYCSRTAEILFRLEASAEGESVDEHGVILRRARSLDK